MSLTVLTDAATGLEILTNFSKKKKNTSPVLKTQITTNKFKKSLFSFNRKVLIS
jgi:hypothetical protein